MSLSDTALEFQVIIYIDETDTVGLDVSQYVSNEGITCTRSAVTRDRAVTCSAKFTLGASLFDNYGTDFPESFDPYTNPRFKPGAIVDIKERDPNTGTYALLEFGGRLRIQFSGLADPYSVAVGEDLRPIGIQLKCVQKCERLAYLRSAYDPYFGTGVNILENYLLGTARNVEELANLYLVDAGLGPIYKESGDPSATAQTNAYVAWSPQKAESLVDYAHKLLAYNPEEEGKMFSLWQDNQERMRLTLLDRTIPVNSNNAMLNRTWGKYSDIEEYLLVEDERPQLAGRIKVTGIYKFAEFKENPIIRYGINGGNTAPNVTSDPTHTTLWNSYDYNDWAGFSRTTVTATNVQGYKLSDGSKYSGLLKRQEITKEYDTSRRITGIREKNIGTSKLVPGREKSSLPIVLSYKQTRYTYNAFGDLANESIEEWALPEAIGETSASASAQKLIGAGSKNRNHTANGSDYSQITWDSPAITTTLSTLLYQTGSVNNTPEARSPAPEIQEEPWTEKQLPVYSIINVIFAGYLLDDRIQTIDVGDLNFSGNLRKLGTIVMLEQVGTYLQRTLKVGYREMRGKCAVPGKQVHVYEDMFAHKKVWIAAGGEVIKLTAETATYEVNLEYAGTIEDGSMLQPAATVRRMPNGNVRALSNGNIRGVSN